MKNRHTLSAVLLTALIAGLAYVGISLGPVARVASPAELSLGQAPTAEPLPLAKPVAVAVAVALPQTPAANDPFPFRLKNTDAPIGELVRNETAVLLRNAFIDTALGSALAIPAEFKTTGDPYTYIAQARGPATAAFRRHITASGGKIISYIPNNAYLVRVDATGAARLANWSGTQSVLPFEPYYKLEMKLLKMALTGQSLPEGALLNVVLFPGTEPAAAKRLAKLGVEVIAQDRTPFGPKLVARVPADKLAALAQLTEVQGLERHRSRRLANDLTRPRLGVEVFTAETNDVGEVTKVTSTNHLGLTGLGIYVNVNDTGVDDSHAAFGNRIKGPGAGKDPDGHGTFVAGIIAGDGAGSDTIKTNPPPGSFEDPDFKGMAIKAKLHVLKYSDSNVNNHVSDRWLQTESADYHYIQSPKQKYTLISNNSWEYEDESDYTWAAASYDAATRDALPGQPGDQQVIYVFPAGNSGAGTDNGLNASPNTITAPGTAKNVITVGAIESLREVAAESYTSVTNTVTETDDDGNEVEKEEVTTTTNTPFADMSDSDNQVAAFSSRGNVGIGIEGAFGRFKPDLVAPGTFIISTRSADWKNTITSTNAQADADALEKQNDELGDQYRYESGTSVAAPAISGMLALMQEFYFRKLDRTNSPALMKALLINSAQSVDARYNHNVRGTINHQGWGLPNLGRAVPALADDNKTDEDAWPMRFIDQSLTNALATGESRSWEITLGSNTMHYPLRFTLAWTDPPGNPNAAVKLVNDLDLIVTPISRSPLGQDAPPDPVDPDDEPVDTTTDTNQVYYGNNIGSSVYSTMGVTNDVINNVENVFIEEPSAEKYRITVYARRVNVDSLSAFYDAETPTDHVDVVQDFALVMSSANPEVKDAFQLKEDKPEAIELPAITTLTNGMPMLNQRVGANSPLAKTNDPAHTVFANRSGITNQWHFYTFTNAPPETTNQSGTTPDDDENKPSFGRHVAFITFMSPNLSTPRHREADIDLYVSRDANLTNLEPAVLDAAFRSTGRGGTEYITFDDARVAKDEVFYIGVKSEDQMAAEFGLVGLSTDNASGFMDDGNLLMMPMPAIIPDGSAANPGGVSVFGIYTGNPYDTVRKVTATSIIHHEEVGDLWGQLSHDRDGVVLNNHTLADPVTGKPYPTDFVFIYDDDLIYPMPTAIPSDGPGSLNDFKWQPAMGVWQFDMVDSALSFTGLVQHLSVTVDAIPNLSLAGDRGIDVHLDPGESEDFLIDVPFNATNMIVQLTEMSGPVDVYLRKDSEPDIKSEPPVYDKSTLDADLAKGEWDGSAPRGGLHYGLADSPPLSEGRWFVTTDNPGIDGIDFHLKVIFEYDISLDNTIKLVSAGPETIDDDIVNTSMLTVTNDFLVGSVEIGVRIDHPRLADLDLHLVSPQGTRLLLSENRGHTNIAYGVTLTEEVDTVPVFEDGFETADNDFIDDSAKFHSGWELDSGEVYVYSTGEAGLSAHSGVQFLEMNGLEPGTISTNAVTEADKTYRLQFAYAKNPDADEPLEMKVFIGTVTNLTVTASIDGPNDTLDWQMQDVVFTAKSANTLIKFQSLANDEYAVLLDSVRLDEVTSANLYAVFSELENLAKGSMKFGDAPFAKEEEQVLFSGFEDAPIGLAKTNDIVDGWTVLNEKARISKSSKAHSGAYYATLSHDSASEAKEDHHLVEDFDSLKLGPFESSTESGGDGTDWTATAPDGWVMVLGPNHGPTAGGDGVKEFNGWTFVDPVSWENTAPGQGRTEFTKGTVKGPQFPGVIAVADSDEYDDLADAKFDAALSTPAVNIAGVAAGALYITYDSSWRQEPQQGKVLVSFDGGAPVVLLELTPDTPTAYNETVTLALNNPEGAKSAVVTWDHQGHNNWWWAIDNVRIYSEKVLPGGAIWRDLPTAVGQDYRLSFVTLASGDDAEYVLGGVVTNRVDGAITVTNSIPKSADWVTNKIRFTAARSSTPLTFRTESSAFRLDTIELIGPGPHNLAEEALGVLSGERAMGEWTLEVRDHRVGGDNADTDIEPVLLSWYIKIMGSDAEDTEVTPETGKPYTRNDTAEALNDGKKVRGRIYKNETHYWTVETCSDSTKLTIELSSVKKKKNAKVSLLASYGGFPSADTATDDFVRVDMNASYFAKLVIGDTGHLPLQPGELLYLTVQKSDTNVTERALYDIVAKWNGDCGGGSPPNTSGGGIIHLANATGSESGLAKPNAPARFLWSIPPGTPAALLEASGLTADADIELISADGRHFRNSIHLGQAPEQIVLREGGMIPSLEGDWVVQVNTIGDEPSEFTLHTTLAGEQGHLVSSQPIEMEIESQYWPPTVRLDWPSVPGERYVLESSENLVDWAPVHEQTAGSSGLVFHAERSWFGERYYRVKQVTDAP